MRKNNIIGRVNAGQPDPFRRLCIIILYTGVGNITKYGSTLYREMDEVSQRHGHTLDLNFQFQVLSRQNGSYG